MGATDRVIRLDAELGFEWGQEGIEIRQAEGVGLMDDTRQTRIDQRREDDGAHAVGLALGIDAGNRLLGFLDVVEKGDADLLELDVLELGHQAVAEGFDGQAGAVGHEKNGAFDSGRHPVILPAVTQSGGDAVDGQVNATGQTLVGIAGAVSLEQLDLQMVQRIHVG